MNLYMTPRAFWHLQWMAQRMDCDPPCGGAETETILRSVSLGLGPMAARYSDGKHSPPDCVVGQTEIPLRVILVRAQDFRRHVGPPMHFWILLAEPAHKQIGEARVVTPCLTVPATRLDGHLERLRHCY